MLYFGLGRFISHNSRNGYWGRGAIDTISDHLDRELPGLRGFSARNLRNMRTFYEEWTILDIDQEQTNLAVTTAKSNDIEIGWRDEKTGWYGALRMEVGAA